MCEREIFLIVFNTSFFYSVLFKTVNVAKKLAMSWSPPAGMSCRQEKLLVRHSFSREQGDPSTPLLCPQCALDKNVKL